MFGATYTVAMKRDPTEPRTRLLSRGLTHLVLAGLIILTAMDAEAFLGGLFRRRSAREDEIAVPVIAHAKDYRRRVAVCVGINDYEGYEDLRCPVNDATAMARTLEDYGFDHVALITGEDATREGVLEELAGVKADAGRNELFVFFFAGHGWTIRNGAGGMMGYLAPSGCRPGYESRDGISMAGLKELAESMPGSDSLFLIDACYSGYALTDGVAAESIATGDSVYQVITAGGELDRAFEADGYGLFTRHVLNCLRNAANRGNALVSARWLASIVKQKVASETGGWQTPQFGHAGEGDIVLEERARGINLIAQAQ
jgi:uncharacterized caspase-like protein